MPLPSSGGLILVRYSASWNNTTLAGRVSTPESLQLMIEAERRLYADRAFTMATLIL